MEGRGSNCEEGTTSIGAKAASILKGMPGRAFNARVKDIRYLAADVLQIRFEPDRKLRYTAGQFLSVVVPTSEKPVKRLYSFANDERAGSREGFEICAKILATGLGSNFLTSLKSGDSFKAFGPYGDFVYHPSSQASSQASSQGRPVCFVCTGTGVAPVRAMIQSAEFSQFAPSTSICLAGYRSEKEVLYAEEFRALGVKTEVALSQSLCRVTDLVGKNPDFPWVDADYYLCGNPQMIQEVRQILTTRLGVPRIRIFAESFGGK